VLAYRRIDEIAQRQGKAMDRRDFIAKSGAGIAVTALGASVAASATSSSTSPNTSTETSTMPDKLNRRGQLTRDTAALLLVDHQVGLYLRNERLVLTNLVQLIAYSHAVGRKPEQGVRTNPGPPSTFGSSP